MNSTPDDIPLRVAVVGAAGKMGRFACELLEATPGFEVVARVERGHDLEAALAEARPEVGLDLTVAGLGREHGLRMLAAGVRPVIGTSGVSLEDTEALDAEARRRGLGGLVVPNFSLSVWVLQQACELAARHFEAVEIVESHHATKVDAPSGTALDTAERLAAVQGRDDPRSIPIHSLRLPGLYSNQEVVFGGPGEVLRIAHETYGRECFAPGILAALRYARTAAGIARGIGPAFLAEAGG